MSTVCIDFGGSVVKVARSEGGVPVAERSGPAPEYLADLARVAQMLAAVRGDAVVTSAGVALPGIVDAGVGGLVGVGGKYGDFDRFDMRAWVAEQLGLPRERVALENDARAALVGELFAGCAQDVSDAVLLIVGTGLGTAVAHDRVLLQGAHGHAGVLGGHLTIAFDGPPCTCGNRGCAEAIAGTWALERTWVDVAGGSPSSIARPVTYRTLLEAVEDDDPAAARVWARVRNALVGLLVSLCHAHDPDAVVFSGGPLSHPAFDAPGLMARVHERLYPSSFHPETRVASHPERSVLLGLDHLARLTEESA